MEDKTKIKVINKNYRSDGDEGFIFSDISDWDEVTEEELEMVYKWASKKGYYVVQQINIYNNEKKLIREIIDNYEKEKKQEEKRQKEFKKQEVERKAKLKKKQLAKAKKLLLEAGEM